MKKTKKMIICALAVAMSAPMWQSCEKVVLDEETSTEAQSCKITFNLLTPSVSRATSAADFRAVWVLDVVNNHVVQTIEQRVGSTPDFGSPTLTLTEGVHTLRFFATDAQKSAIDKGIVTQQPLGDTFVKSLIIDTRKESGTKKVILERQVAKVIYVGEGTATFQGVLSSFDMNKMSATSSAEKVTLKQNESFYTFIPVDNKIKLEDGKEIPVAKNQVTKVGEDGSHEGGDDPVEPSEGRETLVLETDTALIYVSDQEIGDVYLSEYPEPHLSFAEEMGKYRMPTRREALVLNTKTIPADYWTGDRCLCYDSPQDAGKTQGSTKLGTGKYYSFLWGSGSVTQAGQKQPYSIMPIRSVPLSSISLSYEISADFTWDADTTKVK